MASGNDTPDKFARAGFHATPSTFVDAPLIDELPMALECKLLDYNPENCRLFGEIVNVSCDEKYLDADGRIDVDKLKPITFDPAKETYVALGEKVADAFSIGAKMG